MITFTCYLLLKSNRRTEANLLSFEKINKWLYHKWFLNFWMVFISVFQHKTHAKVIILTFPSVTLIIEGTVHFFYIVFGQWRRLSFIVYYIFYICSINYLQLYTYIYIIYVCVRVFSLIIFYIVIILYSYIGLFCLGLKYIN